MSNWNEVDPWEYDKQVKELEEIAQSLVSKLKVKVWRYSEARERRIYSGEFVLEIKLNVEGTNFTISIGVNRMEWAILEMDRRLYIRTYIKKALQDFVWTFIND
jgi:hypothetical protein